MYSKVQFAKIGVLSVDDWDFEHYLEGEALNVCMELSMLV